MDREFKVWELNVQNDVDEENWNQNKIICDCPKFQKNFICKHSIVVRLNLASFDLKFIF